MALSRFLLTGTREKQPGSTDLCAITTRVDLQVVCPLLYPPLNETELYAPRQFLVTPPRKRTQSVLSFANMREIKLEENQSGWWYVRPPAAGRA